MTVPGAKAVREEDSFDVARMAAWLRQHASDPTGLDIVPEVLQFSGGASNLTYLLRYPARDLIMRRPPAGKKAKSAHDMKREYLIQSRLKPVFPYVADMIALCDDESVLGSEFYVMQRLDGTILRADFPDDWSLSRDEVRTMCTNVLDTLIALHTVDPSAAGLDELSKGTGYVGRQVAGWSDRYRKAATPDVGDYDAVMVWLAEHQPDDVRTCVIHNDFRFDNVVLAPQDPMRVVGVLDWEMATLGDPLMDLGGALAYWIQADDDPFMLGFRRQPTNVEGMLTRAEVLDYYCQRMGLSVTPEQWRFYEIFGLFRLAVIAQQIYYRFYHGQTHNEMYKFFHPAVVYLEKRCTALIAQAR